MTQVRASEENVFKKIYEVGNEWDEGFGGTIHAPVEWGTNLTEWLVCFLNFVSKMCEHGKIINNFLIHNSHFIPFSVEDFFACKSQHAQPFATIVG